MTDLALPHRRRAMADKALFARCLLGLCLMAVWWTISWTGIRPFSDYYFFPLWLGYIFAVDGLVELRTGTSPIQRDRWRVLWMFAVSIPLWWLFEAFNEAIGNWKYLRPEPLSPLATALWSSLSFSTVVPAVLTTTELVQSFRLDPLRRLPRIVPTTWLLIAIHLTGWLMVGATLLWPQVFFPLAWISVVLVLDPIATWLGGRSLAWHIDRGDWSPLVNLGLGTLICGWFWEMWNIYSMPKWTYQIPHVEFLHVFEMPLLGFGGYVPFGYEVYLFTLLARRLLPWLRIPESRVSSRSD